MAGSSKWRCGEWRGYGDEGIWGGGMGREKGGRNGGEAGGGGERGGEWEEMIKGWEGRREGRKEWRREMREGEEWEGMREKGGRNGWTRSDKMVVVLSLCCSNAASVV